MPRPPLSFSASAAWLGAAALLLAACGGQDPGPVEGDDVSPWSLEQPWTLEDPAPEPDRPDMRRPDPIEPDMRPSMPDIGPPEPVDFGFPPVPDMTPPPEPDMTPLPRLPTGASCIETDDCLGDTCLPAPTWPGGYCTTTSCGLGQCASQDGECVERPSGASLCLKPCNPNINQCRPDYECRVPAGAARPYCVPHDFEPEQGVADGEACTSDDACEGGSCITEADGWPGGFCTTIGCETRRDCARQGFDNRCYQNPRGENFCVRICTTGMDCRDEYICQMVGGGQGFCVPDPTEPLEEDFTAYPFPITCEDPGGQTYDVDYTIDPGTTSYMFTTVARDGRDLFATQATLPSGTLIDYGGSNAFQTITSQLFGAINPLVTPAVPQFGAQLEVGQHTLRLNTQSQDVCRYLLQESTPGTTLDMNIYFVGVPSVNSSTAANDPNIQKVLARFDQLYAPMGIQSGTVRYYDIGGQQAQQYQIIRSDNAIADLVRLSERPGPTYDEVLSINIFFVRAFAMQNDAIGISQGIPGAAGLHGTRSSGVVFTSEFLGQTFIDQQGRTIDGDDYTGGVLAHEVGHFLGLFHTTESFGRGADPLQDTPRCARQDFPDGCADLTNLMFPFAGIDHTEVTPGQGFVIQSNPLTKD